MKISEQGLRLIKRWEGCKLEAYLDPVKIPSIGYGCIVYPDGKKVRLGDRITQEQADAFLLHECQHRAEAISKLIAIDITQNQFDALLSLAYNIGEGAFAESTLLRRLNASDLQGAAEQFLAWNKATVNGVKIELSGLTNRRQDEKRLFESDSAPGEVINIELSPQERVTWLEAYGEQGKTLIVAWNQSQTVEILELQTVAKHVLIDVIEQYPNASNLLIAEPGKAVPSGPRVRVYDRRLPATPGPGSAAADPPPPVPAGVLSRGSTGSDVTTMQKRLQDLGYYSGPLNGDFDSETDAAVRSFQADWFGSAEADGRVGPITWGALWPTTSPATGGTLSPPGEPGKTYLRLTRTNSRDKFGLTILHLDYIKDGEPQGTLKVCSGAPGRQAFRTAIDSQPLSSEPLPEGLWTIHNIEWCDGRDNYNGAIFQSGLGPVSTPITYRGPGSTRRSAIEIHLDWNKDHGAPGTAGCIGVHSIGDYKTLVAWLRDTDPRDLFVDWGLGTCPTP